MSRPRFWQRRFYVHPIQRKYLSLSLIPVVICSVAVILLALLPMNLLLTGPVGEFERAVAGTCLSSLGRRLLPALFISMVLAAGFSVLATHTMAGPLYRLEEIGKRLAAGEIPGEIRIRQGDDLQEIAATLDLAVGNLRQALVQVRQESGRAQERLRTLEQEASAGRATGAALSASLREVAGHLDGVQAAVRPFRIETAKAKDA